MTSQYHLTTEPTSQGRRDALPAFFDGNRWVLGEDPSIRRIAMHAERASKVECTVLITGETGTGKEVWANLIHQTGPRSTKPFVPVNCAALTPTLAESQLFGHEKGSFTGAMGASLGVFRSAHGGVVFLDEVGEMPLELQPKLLRVLQEGEVTPVGSSTPVSVNVQVIAATNRNLAQEVETGAFREDLFFRLNMVELTVPPLRRRTADIPAYIRFFVQKFAQRYDRAAWVPTETELSAFCEYAWPGNIRQLSHVIEQAYVLDCSPVLPSLRGTVSKDVDLPFFNLDKLRMIAVRQALRATQGHKGRAAKLLGVHANTMTRLLAQLDDESQVEE